MKKIMFLVAALVLSVTAMAQVQDAYPSYVQVTGYAEIEVEPDEFYLSIKIKEGDSKGKVPIEVLQEQMIEALTQLGIDVKEQLKMSDMNSMLFKKKHLVSTAFYELKLFSPKEIMAVYDALDNLGITYLSVSRMTNSEIERYKDQVRIDAMENAREKAEALAGAIGQKVGKCFYIYDSSTGPSVTERYENASIRVHGIGSVMSLDEAIVDNVPDFKKIRVESTISTKFVLE